jgi:hypothetical protein
MRYEKLTMYALDWKRWEGPDGMANANYYDAHFVPEIDKKRYKSFRNYIRSISK